MNLKTFSLWAILVCAACAALSPTVTKAQTSVIPQQCADSSGSGTTQSCNTQLAFTPVRGDNIVYRTTTANTGDVTLAINGGSAYHLRKWLSASVLAAGDLPANTPVYIVFDGTYWNVMSIGNPPTSIIGTGNQYGSTYWATTTSLGSTTPPTTNGQYNCGYAVSASAAVAPTCPELGVNARALTGSATTDTVLYSDNGSIVEHDVAATGAIAETLPTATTLANSSFVFSYCNYSPQTDTLTPTTWTINGNASISVAPKTCHRIIVDPNSSTNWLSIGQGPGVVPTYPTIQFCGTTSSCSATIEKTGKIVYGSAALVTGSPSTVTISGISPAFTSSSSYVCTVAGQSAATTSLYSVANVSGSSFTITGPATDTNVVNYICVGI